MLHWKNEQPPKTLDGAVINPAAVQLVETGQSQPPSTRFRLWRKINPIANSIAIRLGRVPSGTEPWRRVADLDPVVLMGNEYRLQSPHALAQLGRFSQSTYRFNCDHYHWSEELHVTQTRFAVVHANIGGGLAVPTLGGTATMRAGFGRVAINVRAVQDPQIEASIVWPWSEQLDLADLIRSDIVPEATSRDTEIEDLLSEMLPTATPSNWDIRLDTPSINLDEGEEVTLRVSVNAPTPGRAAFAVALRDVDQDQLLVSEVFEYEVMDAPAVRRVPVPA